MYPQEIILLAVVAVVGVPSALVKQWRPRLLIGGNPTAAALVIAYLASQAGLPLKLFTVPDIFTLAAIFWKPRYRPCEAYWDLSDWQRLKCIFSERSPADRFVMLTIPVAWCFYAPVLSYTQYWALFWIAIAQFLAAGSEQLFILRRFADAASHQSHSRNGLEAAIA